MRGAAARSLLPLILLITSISSVLGLQNTSFYLGCLKETSCVVDGGIQLNGRLLANYTGDVYYDSMTRELCEGLAIAAGAPYFGLQDGGECWLGMDLCNALTYSTDCTSPCANKTTQMCGGPCAMDTFYTSAIPSKTIDCPGIPATNGQPDGTRWQRCCTVTTAGGTCNAICSPGWEANNGAALPSATCNANATAGFWNNATGAACVPAACRQAPPANMTIGVAWNCSVPTAHGATCTSVCAAGYNGSSVTSTCSYGTWTVNNQCKPLLCTTAPTQPPPANSQPFNCTLPKASGSPPCYSRCLDGYEGAGWADCRLGVWSYGGSCSKQVCGTPPATSAANALAWANCTNSTTNGGLATCRAACLPGYVGSVLATCDNNGRWVVSGICVPNACTGQPVAAAYANPWNCMSNAPSGTVCQTTCTTSCPNCIYGNYKGRPTSTCTNGAWGFPEGTCKRVTGVFVYYFTFQGPQDAFKTPDADNLESTCAALNEELMRLWAIQSDKSMYTDKWQIYCWYESISLGNTTTIIVGGELEDRNVADPTLESGGEPPNYDFFESFLDKSLKNPKLGDQLWYDKAMARPDAPFKVSISLTSKTGMYKTTSGLITSQGVFIGADCSGTTLEAGDASFATDAYNTVFTFWKLNGDNIEAPSVLAAELSPPAPQGLNCSYEIVDAGSDTQAQAAAAAAAPSPAALPDLPPGLNSHALSALMASVGNAQLPEGATVTAAAATAGGAVGAASTTDGRAPRRFFLIRAQCVPLNNQLWAAGTAYTLTLRLGYKGTQGCPDGAVTASTKVLVVPPPTFTVTPLPLAQQPSQAACGGSDGSFTWAFSYTFASQTVFPGQRGFEYAIAFADVQLSGGGAIPNGNCSVQFCNGLESLFMGPKLPGMEDQCPDVKGVVVVPDDGRPYEYHTYMRSGQLSVKCVGSFPKPPGSLELVVTAVSTSTSGGYAFSNVTASSIPTTCCNSGAGYVAADAGSSTCWSHLRPRTAVACPTAIQSGFYNYGRMSAGSLRITRPAAGSSTPFTCGSSAAAIKALRRSGVGSSSPVRARSVSTSSLPAVPTTVTASCSDDDLTMQFMLRHQKGAVVLSELLQWLSCSAPKTTATVPFKAPSTCDSWTSIPLSVGPNSPIGLSITVDANQMETITFFKKLSKSATCRCSSLYWVLYANVASFATPTC